MSTAPDLMGPYVAQALAEVQTPPLTNRGCLTPEETGAQQVVFHLDYLKVTIFADFMTVRDLVEAELLDEAGFTSIEWLDKGSVQRWERIWEGPGPVSLLVPKYQAITYTVVEVKGQGCQRLGPHVLREFLRRLGRTGVRWHGLRVDLAFDHVAFGPRVVNEAIRRGDLNSRCLSADDRGWADSPSGSTSYLGRRDQRKDRRLRVYDCRGFNRCEAELRGDWAASALRKFAAANLEEWADAAIGLVRGTVDFVDSSANSRPDRCPLLPWWEQFVGSVERIRNLSEEDRRQQRKEQQELAIGTSEKRIKRASRTLWPMIEAFGGDYVIARLRHYADGRLTPEDQQLAQELKRFRYSGLAGLPNEAPADEDPPF